MTFVIILQYNIIHIISVAPLPGLRYQTLGAKVRGEQYHDFEVFSGFQPSVSQWTTEIDRYSDSWIVIIHNCNYEIPVKKIVSYNEKKCKSLFSIVTTNSFYYASLPFSSTRPSMKRWVGNPWERIQPYTYPILVALRLAPTYIHMLFNLLITRIQKLNLKFLFWALILNSNLILILGVVYLPALNSRIPAGLRHHRNAAPLRLPVRRLLGRRRARRRRRPRLLPHQG